VELDLILREATSYVVSDLAVGGLGVTVVVVEVIEEDSSNDASRRFDDEESGR